MSGEIRTAPIAAPNHGFPPHYLEHVYPAKIGNELKIIPPAILKKYAKSAPKPVVALFMHEPIKALSAKQKPPPMKIGIKGIKIFANPLIPFLTKLKTFPQNETSLFQDKALGF